jgi:hypothetical protein
MFVLPMFDDTAQHVLIPTPDDGVGPSIERMGRTEGVFDGHIIAQRGREVL